MFERPTSPLFWLRSVGKTGIIASEERVFVPRSEIIFTVEESPEGGYEARAVGYPIFTQSETLEELKSSLQDAVRCHFDDAARPQLIRIHFVKDEVIPV